MTGLVPSLIAPRDYERKKEGKKENKNERKVLYNQLLIGKDLPARLRARVSVGRNQELADYIFVRFSGVPTYPEKEKNFLELLGANGYDSRYPTSPCLHALFFNPDELKFFFQLQSLSESLFFLL